MSEAEPRVVHTIIGGDIESALAYGLTLMAKCGVKFTPIHNGREVQRLQLKDCNDCVSARYNPHRFEVSPHFVYRCFDSVDRLLYVGCTSVPKQRIDQHRISSWWFEQVHRTRYLLFPNRDYALWKEREAIGEENPRWNIRGRVRDSWEPTDYADMLYALQQNGATEGRLLKLRDEARARFDVDLDEIEVAC